MRARNESEVRALDVKMDRRLKERLVGATILVSIAVLFVPELLSGPPRPVATRPAEIPNQVPTSTAAAVRTYTVDLSNPGSASAAAPAPEAPSAAPISASPATMADSPRDVQAPAHQTAKADTAPVADTARDAPRSHPPLESMAPRPQVQTLPAAQPAAETVAEPTPVARASRPANSFAPIGAKGGWAIQLGSFVSAANADKLARTLRGKGIRVYVSAQGGKHRVRAGPFPDRAAADRAAAKLKSQGQSVSIIAP